jgi:glycosyltransferase involved in cell wall biosynthesis
MTISIVIPTRNRLESLNRLLRSIDIQTVMPAEIIIVDSSDEDISEGLVETIAEKRLLKTPPSVCLQRNRGIALAQSGFILLCDDDIELPEDYLLITSNYLQKNPEKGVVTGLWEELEEGKWITEHPIKSFSNLLLTWFFGLSIWGRIDEIKTSFLTKPIHTALVNYYKRKDNTLTKSGWPTVTEAHYPVNSVAVTSLGSALIRKSWLQGVKFEESLVPNGYGDNYGVCIQFPGQRPVDILMTCLVKHHHIKLNRNPADKAIFFRTMALHLFLKKSKRFGAFTMICFYWSLIGQSLKSLLTRRNELLKAYVKVFFTILLGKNPYLNKK